MDVNVLPSINKGSFLSFSFLYCMTLQMQTNSKGVLVIDCKLFAITCVISSFLDVTS